MDNNIDFTALWSQQHSEAPQPTALISKAKALQRKTRMKFVGGSILLLVTLAFIVLIWLNIKPQLISTSIGIVLTIAAIVMSVVYNMGIIKLVSAKTTIVSAKSFLEELIKLKHKQEFMHKVIMSIYFIVLSAGVFLYMFEFILKMETIGRVIAYSMTAAWFAFTWFYLRPITIKKQQKEINMLIDEFERVNTQFEEL
jgi:amino acid transporter